MDIFLLRKTTALIHHCIIDCVIQLYLFPFNFLKISVVVKTTLDHIEYTSSILNFAFKTACFRA